MNIVKAVASSAALKVYGVGLAFVTSLLLARLMGSAGYGAYAFATSIVALLSVPSSLGLDRLSVRLVPILRFDKSWGLLNGFVDSTRGLTLRVSIVLSALAGAAVYFDAFGFDPGFRDSMLVALLLVPIYTLTALRQAVLRGLKHVAAGQIPELLLRPTLLLMIVVLAMLLAPSLVAPVPMMMATVAAGAVAYLVGRAILNAKLRELLPESIEKKQQVRIWLREAIPFMGLGLITVANNRIEMLLLGALSSPSETGIFHVASRLADLCPLVLYAFNTAAAPHFSELLASGQRDVLRQHVKRITGLIFLATTPVVFAYVTFGSSLLGLFGPEFRGGAGALACLALAQLFNAATGSVATVLNMAGKANATSVGIAAGIVVNIVVGVLLIPTQGAFGAACAGGAALVTWNGVLLYFCVKELRINPSIIPLPIRDDVGN